MTKDELFTLITLKLGAPRTLVSRISGISGISGGKSLNPQEIFEIDYACEFISLAASQNFLVNSERELNKLHAEYAAWYNFNRPSP